MNLSGKDGGVKKDRKVEKGENPERVAFLVRYTKIRDAMDKKRTRKAAALSGLNYIVLFACKNLRDLVDSLCETANLS